MVDMPQNPTKTNNIYLIYVHKEDLALKPTKKNPIYLVYTCIKSIWQ